MAWLLWALAFLFLGGILSASAGRNPKLCTVLGAGSALIGCLLGLFPALGVLLGRAPESLHWDWHVPYGSLALGLDNLSAFFAVCVFLLCGLGALYGGPYLLAYRERKNLGLPWFHYNILTASMVVVVLARNGVLFLTAWEIMALSSFFLVTFEDEKEEVREAGKTYLIASHLGTAFLLAYFVVLGREAGSLDFDRLQGPISSPAANLLFLLALVGFGTKAGLMPFHVWLPEAHPAAPSHVSAVMSGVMIKMGVYGLVRTIMLLPAPPIWWGAVLMGLGLASGILGVLFAMAQHDLKRLLAYSTVENSGVIALGLGAALIGMSDPGLSEIALLGCAGALLHVFNHALFKGLLFLGAGVVAHAAGTRDMNRLGGLAKRMPYLAGGFFIGTAAICAVPPLNGFASEFLIFLGLLRGGLTQGPPAALFLIATASLALIGGLAVVAFTKTFGMVFLGEPRSPEAAQAHPPEIGLTGPILFLAAGCFLVGLLAFAAVRLLIPVASSMIHFDAASLAHQALGPLVYIAWGGLLMLILTASLVQIRRHLLSGQVTAESVTWGCGYARPTARMQYTASSYVQPALDFFASLLRPRKKVAAPAGLFPSRSDLATETDDLSRQILYRPIYGVLSWLFARLRWLQHGYVHLYILYVGLTLVALLVWYASVRSG
jgi:hydrogenase-4 component B